MTVTAPATYCFATAAHWSRGLLHRMEVGQGVTAIRRLSSSALRIGPGGPMSNVALTPGGIVCGRLSSHAASGARLFTVAADDRLAGPFEIDGALASSPRWVIDRRSIWAFAPGNSRVERYERDTLQHDLSIGAPGTVVDVTPDGRQGTWLLVRRDEGFELVHVDCRGCTLARYPVPCEASVPTQLGSAGRGRQLVLLVAEGKRLLFVDTVSGKAERTLTIGTLAPCWSARLLSTDGRNRIALWGESALQTGRRGSAFVLDGSGDTIDGPIDTASAAVAAVAVRTDVLLFATDHGLLRLRASEGSGGRESDSTFLTPPLKSPDSNPVRGWLRAEVFADLPRGSVIEAEFASTNDPNVAAQAGVIADDRSTTTTQRQDALWQLLEHSNRRQFRYTSAPASGEPIAIPLFESRDRWLWLRLKLLVPPGSAVARIRELRVFYPEQSLAQHLPSAFFGERSDPTGTMRRLVGVLESTSQRIDERIRGIGEHIDPFTAPNDWLDYLARWLDLPWDDELPDDAKRRVLQAAGELLDERGTRSGITRLLKALTGPGAAARVADLTVDHAAAVVGGRGAQGPALPALLGGLPLRTPTLGGKAVVGRACVATPGDPGMTDPFDTISPTIRVEITAAPDRRRRLEPLLPRILAQYVPAGVRVRIRWTNSSEGVELLDEPLVLDDEGSARLGRDSTLGRTVLEGRRGRLTDAGLGDGFTVQ